ncbi:DNA repair protein RecO [Spirosoma utsteinense]|uniref:DNA repair protein RecO n=1 Tax=Spirosoma utsteinense TaxID=2585773 RepID=A0ABR6W0N0_9BACT|nr:DNA repair protein RecO [Spirosoma utsteinense]MBC3786599.1 DNA repair protein RecO (recombination protein O) [Spirosoma utsteinense]MBC3789977.1 DNA repair protein RecO (recombination protein O) [Spirosoma utsteinense]
MLQKTRGIALSYIRYRETSIIARIYTEEFGLQSYIVNSVRTARSKNNRIALFQPLTLLDMVVYHKNDRDLHRISEVKTIQPFQSLPFDVAKSTIAMFVTEMLNKVLKEEASSPVLFRFLIDSILFLEEASVNFENFHLAFLLKLSFFLGFGPESDREFESQLRENSYPFLPDKEVETALNIMLKRPLGTPVKLTRTVRNDLLDALVAYYQIHIDSIGEVKSLPVLREVLG